MKVTIGIKALNEEATIAASLQSALDALAGMDGEVILADSGSTDRTVAIAQTYPVRIVQFADLADRGCGAGAQLAFQHSRGDYFYMLDGDMTLDPDMIRLGVAYLDAHPGVAGVGGRVIEHNLEGQEFQVRADKAQAQDGPVDRLDCGGLYRAEAVRAAGYFADRNLHAFEEFELAARLAAQGWGLARIDHPGVNHFGHRIDGYHLLWRRLRSGYSDGLGEMLRGALGRPHLGIVLRRSWPLQMAVIVIGWWLAIAALLIDRQWLAMAGLLVLPVLLLSLRRRSLALGCYSFATCNVLAIGLVRGLFRRRTAPTEAIAARDLTSPPAAAAS
jgi:glycosyltransferase involved in cell wall biosynthesis